MRSEDPTKLVTSVNQLSSANDGMSRFRFTEVAPRPLTTGDAFFNSEVRFSYRNNGSTRSLEHQSYIRARLTLSQADGTDLEYEDMIAPTMNPLSTIWQKIEWLAGGQTITSVNENVAQVSTLEHRLFRSGSQLDKGENSSYMMSPYFEDRQDLVISEVFQSSARLIARGKSAQVALINEAADTLAYAAGTFTYVDAAGADLDLRLYYKVGDYISFNSLSGNDTTSSVRVIARLTAVTQLTLVIGGGASASTVGTQYTAADNVTLATYAAAVAGNADFDIRKLERKQRSRSFEICWRPPLGMFYLDDIPGTPAGNYELVAQPFPTDTAKRNFIESLGIATKTTADFSLSMDSIYLYVAKFDAPFVKDAVVLLDLFETRLQTKTIPNGSGASQSQEDFVVPPTTNALTLAFQDSRAQNDTRFPLTKFKCESDIETSIEQFYIQYADMQRPERVPSLQYDQDTADGTINQLVQQYYNTMQQNNTLFSAGSCETFEEWRDRGLYFYLDYPRSGEDRATVAQVYYKFAAAVDNVRILLFSHSRKVVTLSIKDSQIEKVQVDYV